MVVADRIDRSRLLENLDRNRKEVRFTGTAEPNSTAASPLREVFYPTSVVSSLYFGTTKAPTDRGSVRFRFRSDHTSPHDVTVFNPDQQGTLEIKLRPQAIDTGDGEKIRKYAITNVPLGKILSTLRTPENFKQLDAYSRGSNIRRMIELLFQRNGIEPFLLTQSTRRHFVKDLQQDAVRMTLDSGTSYWLVSHDTGFFGGDGLLVAKKADTISDNLLEIKKDDAAQPVDEDYYQDLIAELFGEGHDYLIGNRIKRSHGSALYLHYGLPTRRNPEVKVTEQTVEIIEREEKIDVDKDPRDVIASLPILVSDEIAIGPVQTYTIFMRYLQHSPDTTIVEKAFDHAFSVSGFQCKKPISEDGVSVRKEFSARSLAELLDLLEKNPVEGEMETSPIGKRDRIERSVIIPDTGSVFTILADNCTADDTRTPLNQVEIEFQGQYAFPNITQEQIDPFVINNDFARVRLLVTHTLTEAGIQLLPTTTTKEKWLREDKK